MIIVNSHIWFYNSLIYCIKGQDKYVNTINILFIQFVFMSIHDL